MWWIIGMPMVSLTQLYFLFPYHKTAKIWPQPKLVHLWCKQNHSIIWLHFGKCSRISSKKYFLEAQKEKSWKQKKGFIQAKEQDSAVTDYWYVAWFFQAQFFLFPYHKTAKLRPQPKPVHLWCKQNHLILWLHRSMFKKIQQEIFLGS